MVSSLPQAEPERQQPDYQEYQLSSAWRAIASRWPLLILGFAMGSVLGLLFSVAFPARYQATAALAVNIDYGQSTPLELVVEDRALNRVYQLLISDSVLEAVSAELNSSVGEAPEWENAHSLRRQIRLDQRLARWELVGFSESPESAATIANTWSSVALDRMTKAQDHAWRVLELQALPYLVDCFAVLPEPSTEDVVWQCVSSGPKIEPMQVDELRREIEASHGILPNISFELIESATPPEDPVLWSRGALVLAGGLLGLMAAAAGTVGLGWRQQRASERDQSYQ